MAEQGTTPDAWRDDTGAVYLNARKRREAIPLAHDADPECESLWLSPVPPERSVTLEALLADLVRLQDAPQRDDDAYWAEKEAAWQAARDALPSPEVAAAQRVLDLHQPKAFCCHADRGPCVLEGRTPQPFRCGQKSCSVCASDASYSNAKPVWPCPPVVLAQHVMKDA